MLYFNDEEISLINRVHNQVHNQVQPIPKLDVLFKIRNISYNDFRRIFNIAVDVINNVNRDINPVKINYYDDSEPEPSLQDKENIYNYLTKIKALDDNNENLTKLISLINIIRNNNSLQHQLSQKNYTSQVNFDYKLDELRKTIIRNSKKENRYNKIYTIISFIPFIGEIVYFFNNFSITDKKYNSALKNYFHGDKEKFDNFYTSCKEKDAVYKTILNQYPGLDVQKIDELREIYSNKQDKSYSIFGGIVCSAWYLFFTACLISCAVILFTSPFSILTFLATVLGTALFSYTAYKQGHEMGKSLGRENAEEKADAIVEAFAEKIIELEKAGSYSQANLLKLKIQDIIDDSNLSNDKKHLSNASRKDLIKYLEFILEINDDEINLYTGCPNVIDRKFNFAPISMPIPYALSQAARAGIPPVPQAQTQTQEHKNYSVVEMGLLGCEKPATQDFFKNYSGNIHDSHYLLETENPITTTRQQRALSAASAAELAQAQAVLEEEKDGHVKRITRSRSGSSSKNLLLSSELTERSENENSSSEHSLVKEKRKSIGQNTERVYSSGSESAPTI